MISIAQELQSLVRKFMDDMSRFANSIVLHNGIVLVHALRSGS